MTTYLIRRILTMIPMMVLISVILFTMVQLAPGDAFSGQFDPRVDASYYEKMREKFGLNKSPVEQYFIWAKNFVQGEFGLSFRHRMPVSDLISDRIGNTVFLGVCSLILTYSLAIPLGIFSANKPYSKLDYTLTGFSFVGYSMPSFLAGLLLIYLFSFNLKIFPFSGTETAGGGYEGISLLLDRLYHVILPAFTLSLITIAGYNRFVRSSILEAKQQDYVRTARAKGLSKSVVMRKHVLRNALIPLITLFGLDLGLLLGGAVITETIFTYPGIGQLYFEGIVNRDYPIIMAVSMISALTVLLGNLLADILYAVVDPRIRYE
ncbi:ABC transporter permease [Lihuaxuella thermophila]|uniref:Peptide/nickel transport system permease protein n=1 Tax=Lihuaxuella thermophila TaxID=1173111 RepID=A0A1H8HMY0_9BACL|nr:ABC transporter permease [Lihuaxuella thermophila]SEN57008.1 peptide/nickel transport system permease protein [Lihuaxuella thermophila]